MIIYYVIKNFIKTKVIACQINTIKVIIMQVLFKGGNMKIDFFPREKVVLGIHFGEVLL